MRHFATIALTLLALQWITSCSSTKHLAENEKLVTKVKVKTDGKYEGDPLLPVVRQLPNRKTLWLFRIHLAIYNTYDQEKLKKRNEKKRKKIALKNQKRLELGKDSIEFKPVWGYRFWKKSGEPPVIYDSLLSIKSVTALENFLFNRGYFNNSVSYHTSEKYEKRHKKKTKVIYCVHLGTPYKINKLSIHMNDTALKDDIKEAIKGTLVHPGELYNANTLDDERSRFASKMRDRGYYYFNREYIKYEIDSMIGNHKVDVKMFIQDMVKTIATKSGTDSTVIEKHHKYTINKIYVNTSFNPRFTDDYDDSLSFMNLTFINKRLLNYYPRPIRYSIFIRKGKLYSEAAQRYTYSRLSGTNNFKFVNITFEEGDKPYSLDCKVNMTPFPHQSIGFEVEGTNTSSNLGVSGYLTYQNKNIFKGMEIFRVRVKGGVEAQQTNALGDNTQGENNTLSIFNTVEYGIEMSLSLQQLIALTRRKVTDVPLYQNPRTTFTGIYNFQNRPDFKRELINASISYFFTIDRKNRNTFRFFPITVSFIRIDKSPEFQDRLDELNNPLLNSTYDNTFIFGLNIFHIWTNQKDSKVPNYWVAQSLFEIAGNLLYLGNNVFNSTEYNEDGHTFYKIGGIRYAQYIKVQEDASYHNRINKHQKMAYRILGGIGIAYGNSVSLPYDKSFYGGGANDNRAWTARSLGPGSMSDSLKAGIDQVGDIKLEFNIEYRFDIIKLLEGALFVDAGNIWLLRKDEERPNAEFKFDRFYKEIALGAGAGIRFNFGFMLIRFDFGFRIYDPGLPEKNRWVFNNAAYLKTLPSRYNYFTFNLGINYPF